MGMAVASDDLLSEKAAAMRASLERSQAITDDVVSILGSFDHRLSALETAMRPTQIRTHSIRKAHENIDRTLKSAEAILAHFDQYYQAEAKIVKGPHEDVKNYLEAIDQLRRNIRFFGNKKGFKNDDGVVIRANNLISEAISKLEDEFKRLLSSYSKPVEPERLFGSLPNSMRPSSASPGRDGDPNGKNHSSNVHYELHKNNVDALIYTPPILIPPRILPLLNNLTQQMVQAGHQQQLLKTYSLKKVACGWYYTLCCNLKEAVDVIKSNISGSQQRLAVTIEIHVTLTGDVSSVMCVNFTCQGPAWGHMRRQRFELTAHRDGVVVFGDGEGHCSLVKKAKRSTREALRDTRSKVLEESLQKLGVEKLSKDDVQKLQWEVLEAKIGNWIHFMRIAVKLLFAAERKVCDQIFEGFDSLSDQCFAEVTTNSISMLLSFGEAIAKSKRSPEKLFVLLDMYEILQEIHAEIEILFKGRACTKIREAVMGLTKQLAQTAQETFGDFEEAVEKDATKTAVTDGTVHPLTSYVINYVKFLFDYRSTLHQLFQGIEGEGDSSQLASVTMRILQALQTNLDGKSKQYRDPALTHLFLMNNIHYIVRSVRRSEAKDLLGDDWIQRHRKIVQQHANQYKRNAWAKPSINRSRTVVN
ncbi:hypothetical protein JHK87_027765 [Glycine soja]|nr:hypothetical protein JHK87_027765 [Glycine soja]